jgi:hypothetical protein
MSTAATRTTVLPGTADRVATYAQAIRRISWGAIFAGVIIAMVVQVLLGLLGFGIGIASVDPATATSETGRGFAIGMAIWWVVSSLIALFLGGWVAGRLAGFPRAGDGGLHGLVAWAAMTILSLYLVTTAVGALIGGTLSVVGQGLQTAAQGAVASAGGQEGSGSQSGQGDSNMRAVREEARQALRNPQTAMAEADQTLDRLFTTGTGGETRINREEAVNMLVERGNMDRAQAEQTVAQWEQTLQQGRQQLAEVKENVQQTASEARKPVAHAAIWSFVALSLGALAASLGGRVGAPRSMPITAAAVTSNTPTTVTTTSDTKS